MAKTRISLIYDDSVIASSTDTKLSAIVPNGKAVILVEFGGADVLGGDGIGSIIALQWGEGVSFQTVRALSGTTVTFDLRGTQSFIGNGVNRFRVVRQNRTATSKPLAAWVEAIVLDT